MPTPSIFILEWLPMMLNNKALCFYQKSKKKTTKREGIIYLRQVCLSLCLNHSSSKGICIKQVLKYYFENPEEILTSAFKEGINQEKWKKAVALADKERSRYNKVTATSILDEDSEDGQDDTSQEPARSGNTAEYGYINIFKKILMDISIQ